VSSLIWKFSNIYLMCFKKTCTILHKRLMIIIRSVWRCPSKNHSKNLKSSKWTEKICCNYFSSINDSCG
jgi:hypothetical protein